jgi:hypothetical protein
VVQKNKDNLSLYNKMVSNLEKTYYDYLIGKKDVNKAQGSMAETLASRITGVSDHDSS